MNPNNDAIEKLFNDARDKYIIQPLSSGDERRFCEWIDINSSEWQKECAIQIRRYLSLEMGGGPYGVNMDTSDECWDNLKVYTFTDELFDDELEETVEHLVGAVFFNIFPTYILLASCWIHPFYRHRGRLKRACSDFECAFECDFNEIKIEKPISPAMSVFLENRNDHLT